VRVVDAAMERAVRVVTVERGVDPRDLVLVAFGGAGPMHACAIADALGMRAVVVPPRAGVCSAAGLLCAPKAREVVHTFGGGSLADALTRVASEARSRVGTDAIVETAGFAEPDCTMWVPEGWRAEPRELGTWIVRRGGQ